MSAFLNVAFFIGVFYLIILFAGIPDRQKDRIDRRPEEKRAA